MNDLEEPGGFRPHRQVNHGSDSLKKANVAKLAEWQTKVLNQDDDLYGVRCISVRYEDRDDRVVFRISYRFTVEFFTRKNRWRVRGEKKTTHGTVEQFMQWFETQLKG